MSDILSSLLSGAGDFLSSEAGIYMVSFAIIASVIGFMFSLPRRVYKKSL